MRFLPSWKCSRYKTTKNKDLCMTENIRLRNMYTVSNFLPDTRHRQSTEPMEKQWPNMREENEMKTITKWQKDNMVRGGICNTVLQKTVTDSLYGLFHGDSNYITPIKAVLFKRTQFSPHKVDQIVNNQKETQIFFCVHIVSSFVTGLFLVCFSSDGASVLFLFTLQFLWRSQTFYCSGLW